MKPDCYVSLRMAGRCCTCKTSAKEVHCPKKLKSLHCERCCPICSQVIENKVDADGGIDLHQAHPQLTAIRSSAQTVSAFPSRF
jgi:hypothetical protein